MIFKIKGLKVILKLQFVWRSFVCFILGYKDYASFQRFLWYWCLDNLASKGYYFLANCIYRIGTLESHSQPFSGCGYLMIKSNKAPKEFQEVNYEIYNDKYFYDHFVLRLLNIAGYSIDQREDSSGVEVEFYFKDGFRDFSRFSGMKIYLNEIQLKSLLNYLNK